MKRTARAVLVGVALALVMQGAAGQPQAGVPSLSERLLAAERGALQDPEAGRLYPLAASLLAAARDLPASIELLPPAIPDMAPPQDAASAAAATQPAAARQAPAAPPWPQVVDGPVVDEEKLAYARFLAGDYAGAAGLYGALHEQEPDNLHFLRMLFLSTRNAGDAQAAAPLLAELKSKVDSRDWAEWISTMLALGNDEKEER
jgi:predicted Zn-dependent protease